MLINFDYDGVIVDSFEQLLDLSVQAQQSLRVGRAPTRNDFRTIENLTIYDLGKRIGLPEDLALEYEIEFFKLQKENQDARVFPDVIPVLIELAEKNTLIVITSNHTDIVSNTLEKFELDEVISRVLGGDLGSTKAERIEQSRKEYQNDFQNTLMVGDAISDVRQGKLAGVRTVAVTWGFQQRELLIRESPDFVVNNPKELLKIAI